MDIITTEGEKDILANQQRKAVAADRMFSSGRLHREYGKVAIWEVGS